MTKWIVAGMTILTLGLGGAALAKKQTQTDTGQTSCNAKCHVEGQPKKQLQPATKAHVDKCKPKGTCASCHEGKPKGKTAC
jgi:hypothetical protein